LRRAALACGVVAVLVAGCSRPVETAQPVPGSHATTNPAAARFAESLRAKVGVDGMAGHLQRLQEIADRNGGNRAAGTPGYDASVDFVAETLRSKGFEVQTPEFEVQVFRAEKPVLTVDGKPVEATVLRYTAGTDPGGVSGPLVAAPADETPGCTPSDYDGLPVKGAIVLVDRGSCKFTEKLAIVAKLGAAAMVVADNVDEAAMPGALNEDNSVTVPAVSVTKADGVRLRSAPGPASLTLDAQTRTVTSRNVIAQTSTGSTENVVMVGAHLDSVPEGPGINDNGSGVAAVLETAVQLGSAPAVANAVRFGFWGAEELGTVGSKKYVAALKTEQLRDIALYLNFDMLASPNAGYFTYDGDQSTAPGRDQAIPRVPEGSAGIERTLVDYLNAAGKPAQDTFFDGRSDYDAFTIAGVPAGGLFAGAEEKKTAEQAKLWGGEADVPFDVDYHKGEDNLAMINRDALGIQGGGVAYATGLYAQNLDGRNGIPLRDDRTRHELDGS
jgi:Zn-dependent M28 family amino/carboxypeptidase